MIKEVEGPALEAELARLDLGEIEQVVDQDEERVGGMFDHVEVIALAAVELGLEGELGQADDAVERGANFVADVGEEIAFGLVGFLGGGPGPDQFLAAPGEEDAGMMAGAAEPAHFVASDRDVGERFLALQRLGVVDDAVEAAGDAASEEEDGEKAGAKAEDAGADDGVGGEFLDGGGAFLALPQEAVLDGEELLESGAEVQHRLAPALQGLEEGGVATGLIELENGLVLQAEAFAHERTDGFQKVLPLRRVLDGQDLQTVERGREFANGGVVLGEEGGLAGENEAAHARLAIDREGEDALGLFLDLEAMRDPFLGVVVLGDGDEEEESGEDGGEDGDGQDQKALGAQRIIAPAKVEKLFQGERVERL